jgi:hypothetical protein
MLGSESAINVNAGVQVDVQHLGQSLSPRLEYRWAPTP